MNELPPVSEDDDETTSPFDLLERDPDAAELELIRRSRYEADDPVPMREFAKALQRLNKLVREEKSNNRERANQLLELLNRPPNEQTAKLQSEVAELRSYVAKLNDGAATIRKIATWAIVAALGCVGAVGGFIYVRGFSEGESKTRLDHVEKSIDELRSELRPQWPFVKGVP